MGFGGIASYMNSPAAKNMVEMAERAKETIAPLDSYLKQQEEIQKHLSTISPLMRFGGLTAPFMPAAVAPQLERKITPAPEPNKVIPVNPQVETNKLLRQLVESNEHAREEAAEDRALTREEYRRLRKENAYLQKRVDSLEAIAQCQLETVQKLVTIIDPMYRDLGTIASFIRDTREVLGGPALNNLPPAPESEDDAEQDQD